MLQYYGDQLAIPAQIIVQQRDRGATSTSLARDARRAPRRPRVEVRAAERGDKRRILELAERNARLALDQEKLKAERRRQQRVEALDGLQEALGLDALPLRIECFDISQPDGHPHGRLDGRLRGRRAEEVRLPPLHDPRPRGRRPRRLRGDGGGPRPAPGAVGGPAGPQPARPQAQRVVRDAAEPHRHRRRPRPARRPACARCEGFRDRGVAVVSLAKRIEEVFVPGRREPIVLAHDTPELQLLQRVRDEAHRFAITHHRIRRDRAMTASILDDLPGIGPARKRALLNALRLARGGARRHPRAARGASPACPARPRATCARTCTARATEPSIIHSGSPACPTTRTHFPTWPSRPSDAAGCASAAATATPRRQPPSTATASVRRSRLEDLVVITGFSGAGKSTAMDVFEDAGYFCVDNLPPEMIRALVELFVHEGSKVERAAVVSDVRGGDYFEALRAVLDDLAALGARATACCSSTPTSETLLTRYKETRRRHPLAPRVERRRRASPPSARCSSRCASAPTSSSTRPASRRTCCGARSPTSSSPRAPATRLAVTLESLRLQARPRRATPTSSSTCASCPTRTTSPTCAR